jgi:hypothetical protein
VRVERRFRPRVIARAGFSSSLERVLGMPDRGTADSRPQAPGSRLHRGFHCFGAATIGAMTDSLEKGSRDAKPGRPRRAARTGLSLLRAATVTPWMTPQVMVGPESPAARRRYHRSVYDRTGNGRPYWVIPIIALICRHAVIEVGGVNRFGSRWVSIATDDVRRPVSATSKGVGAPQSSLEEG